MPQTLLGVVFWSCFVDNGRQHCFNYRLFWGTAVIQVITSRNQHLYGKQLDQMFRMRHEYYVMGHGWAGLKSANGREVDEFDNLEAVYLVSVDEFGDVAASLRLNPTTGPTLLKKFSDYADDALPVSPKCWDLSRWIARPDQRRADGKRWPSNHQRELALGVLEFCQSRGADCLTMLCEERLAQRIGAYGWRVTYLGQPREYEGGKGTAVAARIDVGDETLSLTRAKTSIIRPVLVEVAVEDMSPSTTAAPTSEELVDLIQEIGPARLTQLVRVLSGALHRSPSGKANEDMLPAGVALLATLNRLIEHAGGRLDLPEADDWKAAPANRAAAGRGTHRPTTGS